MNLKSASLLALVLALPPLAHAANFEWTFNDGTLGDFFGSGTMTPSGLTQSNIVFTGGGIVPDIEGATARVLHVPVFTSMADGFQLGLNATGPNGGGSYLNNYTFIFDIYSPGAAGWQALFQTDPSNSPGNDADWYIAPDSSLGIGDIGYTAAGAVTQDAWHRITFAASLGSEVKYYIDGTLAGTFGGNTLDGRFALYSNQIGGDVRLFNEGDTSGNYTHEMFVNSIAFVDSQLSDEEIAALGTPKAAGILVPEPAAGAFLLLGLAGLAVRRQR